MSQIERLEVEALLAFRDSIENTFKDHIRSSIDLIIGGMECMDQTAYTTEQKIDLVTEMVVKSVKWRMEYERLLRYTKR